MKNMNNENGSEKKSALSSSVPGSFFEIRVKGHLDESWADWSGGLEMKLSENGETMLCGRIQDQAALMGILNKLYSLNLALLSVRETNQTK